MAPARKSRRTRCKTKSTDDSNSSAAMLFVARALTAFGVALNLRVLHDSAAVPAGQIMHMDGRYETGATPY